MKKLFCLIAAPAMLLAMAAGAPADDAVKAAPQPFFRASIVSTDRIKQIATDLGLPLPDPASTIEAKMPFIGAGGLDGSKPLGILTLATDDVDPQQMILFAFPVNAGKATLADFTKMGATAVAGEADMVQMGPEVGFRRTPDYLFMHMGDVAAMKTLANAPFTEDYKKKDTIARIELDVTALRAGAPKFYKDAIDKIRASAEARNQNTAKNDADARGQKIGTEMVMTVLEKLEKLSVALALDDQNLRLAALVTPSPVKGSREFSKPVFAPNAIATAHIVYPSPDAAKWALSLAKIGLDSNQGANDNPELFAKQKQAIEDLTVALVGDSQSLAVESNDGQIILTLVNQYEGDTNLPEVLKKNIPIMAESHEAGKTPPTVEDAPGVDGYTGIRIKPGDAPVFVTVMQKGKTAVITISDKEVAGGPRFTLSPTEKISDVLALHIDLGAAIKAANDKGGTPLAMLPDDQRKMLIEKLTGKELKLTMSNRPSGAMAVDLDVPVDLIKIAAHFASPAPAQ